MPPQIDQSKQQVSQQVNAAGNVIYNGLPQPSRPLPLQSLPRAAHFMDRENALAQLLHDLQPGRVATLCGPGGIGKTALAAEALHRLLPVERNQPPVRFPDGVVVHNFYQQPKVDSALAHIARSLGEEIHNDPLAAAQRALQQRQLLLILDGVERADRLPTLLEIRGDCGVLVTSRQRSDAWERAQNVDPLPERDAIALLQAWGGFYASDETAAAQISDLVGRLPLALRLVGRYLSQQEQPAEIYLDCLRHKPLDALDQGDRRQESISLLLEHSLAELSRYARLALGVVALLALAPFEQNLISLAFPHFGRHFVQPWIDELVNYGLLLRVPVEGAIHLTVSHPLIHTYIFSKLPRDPQCIQSLAEHYTALAEEQSTLGVEGYRRLDGERVHIMNVLGMCVLESCWAEARQLVWALDKYLNIQGHWSERQTILDIGIQAVRELDNRLDESIFRGRLGNAYLNLGKVEKAIRYYKQALVIATEIGDRSNQGAVQGNLGSAYYVLGETEKAIGYYEKALTIAQESDDQRLQGDHLGNLGNAYLNLGEAEEAIGYYKQALASSQEIGYLRGQCADLGNLGLVYDSLGEIEKAIRYYEQALTIAIEIGDRHRQSTHLANLGIPYVSLGEVEKAIRYYEQALTIAIEIGDFRGQGHYLKNMGRAYAMQGDMTKAIPYIKQSLAIQRKILDIRGEGYALSYLGYAYTVQGDLERALDLYRQAILLLDQVDDPRGKGCTLIDLGETYATQGNYTQAITTYQQALQILNQVKDRNNSTLCAWKLGLVYVAQGQVVEAIELMEPRVAYMREIGHVDADAYEAVLAAHTTTDTDNSG